MRNPELESALCCVCSLLGRIFCEIIHKPRLGLRHSCQAIPLTPPIDVRHQVVMRLNRDQAVGCLNLKMVLKPLSACCSLLYALYSRFYYFVSLRHPALPFSALICSAQI